MNIRVKVGEQYFNVEVGDLQTRPVIAKIDGERFEVWPETESAAKETLPTLRQPNPQTRNSNSKTIQAPIPGVVISVSTEPGAALNIGDEVCVLEAMKMKNSIRSARVGQVAAVRVAVGQTVKHKDVLIEYAD